MLTPPAIRHVKLFGTAKSGVEHWKIQRLTSIGLIPLGLWLVISSIGLSGTGYAEARAWLGGVFNATMMMLLVIAGFWHAKLGVQVIIEDYVHHEGAKVVSLVALNLLAVALAVACLISILKVTLGS